MWSLWGDLVWPTMFVPYDEQVLAVALDGLRAHEGELARNDYEELLAARGIANRVSGAERVFGFGSAARTPPYAEVLLETINRAGTWWAGLPRELEPQAPLVPIPADRPITTLLDRVSARDVLHSGSSLANRRDAPEQGSRTSP